MDFALSEELRMLKDMVRDFVDEKIAPFADEWEEKGYYPYEEAIKPMAELGFFGTVIPEEYGGNDMGWLAAIILSEEIARVPARSGCKSICRQQGMPLQYTITVVRK